MAIPFSSFFIFIFIFFLSLVFNRALVLDPSLLQLAALGPFLSLINLKT